MERSELLSTENVMKTFFEKVAGRLRIPIGNKVYIIPLNYETDEKSVIALPDLPAINLKNNNLKVFEKELTKYAEAFFESEAFWANPIESCNNNEEKLIYALAALWLNATFDDYDHPIQFVQRYTNFLRDKTFDDFMDGETLNKMQTLRNCNIEIRQIEQKEFQETPRAILLTVRKGDIEKKMPRIAYGIDGDKAYIYGIQGYKAEIQEEPELKRINRKRFQVNKTDRLPEDYIGVYLKQEPYAYISLFAFLAMLKQKGITKVYMPAYLPERYEAKKFGMIGKAREIAKSMNIEQEKSKSKKQAIKEITYNLNEQSRIQYNVTNKFLAYMSRMECDVPGITTLATPIDNNSSLVVDISEMEPTQEGNLIFYELYKKIEELMKKKQIDDVER